jgi:hypothetical protein
MVLELLKDDNDELSLLALRAEEELRREDMAEGSRSLGSRKSKSPV